MATDTTTPLVNLANLLGGTKGTSSPGDISALQNVLGQLQQQQAGGYDNLLQQIFSQAAGQIPGFTNAYANSVGARSRGNSSIQSALSELLKQATLEGQKQIVGQQNANLTTQANVAGNIAQATKGTTTTSGTNLGNAAKNLAWLQLFSKLKDTPLLSSGLSSLGNMFNGSSTSATPESFTANYAPTAPTIFGSVDPQQQAFMDFGTGQFSNDIAADVSTDFTQPSSEDIQFDNFVNLPEFQPQPVEEFIDYGDYFADGGRVPKGKRNFADGGSVTQRAAGGRRTSAPSISTTAPQTSQVDNTLPREQLVTPTAPAPAPMLTDPIGELSINDLTGKNRDGNVSFGGGDAQVAGAVRGGYNTLNAVNSAMGQAGMSNIPGFGIVGGLVNARDPQEALTNMGVTAAGMLSPALGAVASVARNPTTTGVVDAVASFNPVTAIGNLLGAPFGYSVGSLVEGLVDLANPNNPVGPEQQARADALNAANAANAGGNADVSGGFGSADAVGGQNAGDATGVGGEASDTGYAADGGEIPGQTTGIDDTKQIHVSGGEYVVSADVVDAIGEDFFDMLQQSLHTPAAVQRMRA